MSGLYNAVFGEHGEGQGLVAVVHQRQAIDVGRYRDAWVEAEGDQLVIRIHTRNGGGNREEYEAEIESMRDHPWYVRDADDDYDYTYADFYFRPDPADLDPELAVALVKLAQSPVDMSAKWQAAIDAIKGPSA